MTNPEPPTKYRETEGDEFLIVKTKWWLIVEFYYVLEKLKGLFNK